MASLNIYLNFQGNTEEAFSFYQSVFNGTVLRLQRFGEVPFCADVAESDKNKIMHIALKINEGTILMGTDSLESMGQKLTFGNNIHINVGAESREEADSFFNKLADGGKVIMPMDNAFWGGYFGMATDRFGIHWMINYQEVPIYADKPVNAQLEAV